MTFCPWVYCCYALDGTLLYIGLTRHPAKRLTAHRRHSSWGEQLARTKLYQTTFRHGEFLERRLIQELAPLHNKQFNLRRGWRYRDRSTGGRGLAYFPELDEFREAEAVVA